MRRGGSVRGCLASGVALVAVASIAGLAGVAAAAGADDVEAIVSHGVELRKAGKDREALAEFERAAAIKRTARVVAQIGVAEVALGSWVAAEQHLQEALGHGDDAWIKKNRPALESTLATAGKHLGDLEIWGTPDGAEIAVDGRVVGKLPLAKPVRLTTGLVTVTVQAPGYQPVTRTLQIVSTDLVREHVDLSPPAAGPKVDLAAKKDVGAGGPEAVVAKKPEPAEQKVEKEKRPLLEQWWFWTAVGVVLLGGAGAAIAIVRSRDQIPGCPADTYCFMK